MRLATVAALTASLLSLSVTAAYSAATPKYNWMLGPNPTHYSSFQPTSRTAAFKTTAKVALFQNSGGAGISRSKNIRKVTNANAGIYCIYTVSSVKLDPANTYPTVTVEWSDSGGNALEAFIVDSRQNCGSGADIDHTLEVKTFDLSSGAPIPNNNVAFYLTVQ